MIRSLKYTYDGTTTSVITTEKRYIQYGRIIPYRSPLTPFGMQALPEIDWASGL
jgi:hypothetical protein